jgi:hypothetical protein
MTVGLTEPNPYLRDKLAIMIEIVLNEQNKKSGFIDKTMGADGQPVNNRYLDFIILKGQPVLLFVKRINMSEKEHKDYCELHGDFNKMHTIDLLEFVAFEFMSDEATIHYELRQG